MAGRPPSNLGIIFFFSMVILGMTFISSQSQLAFAGVQGGESDPDGDNVFTDDNCPFVYNPGQEDVNDDGIGDACIPPSQLVEEVIGVVDDTIEDISDLSDGQIDSLVGKLESAAEKLDNEKINGAIGSLNSFINQIEAYINSGQIPNENDGLALIEAVQSIIDAIED